MTPFWNWIQEKIGILSPRAQSEGYCFGCRTRRIFAILQDTILENGRRIVQGICPECGTKMSKIVARV